MKRSTLTLVTAGMILAGAGAVEILGDNSAASTETHQDAPATAHGNLAPSMTHPAPTRLAAH